MRPRLPRPELYGKRRRLPPTPVPKRRPLRRQIERLRVPM
uniref:Uncharacterized protein n=1 Tax=Romanomermis culicivorax TaxID=13658 RepID=A0A915L5K7_ROMCU